MNFKLFKIKTKVKFLNVISSHSLTNIVKLNIKWYLKLANY